MRDTVACLWVVLSAGWSAAPRAATAQVAEIAVERRLAAELKLRVGDTVAIGTRADALGLRGVVRAIYEPEADPASVARRDWNVRFHLPDLERLLSAPDRVDRFAVALRSGVSVDSAVRELNRSAFGFRAYPSAAIASESSQTFAVVSRFHRAIAVISIVASTVFLLCIMLLKVEERRADAAMMRFIGVRRRTIFAALALEACLVAGAGSVFGVLLAQGAGALVNAYYRRYYDTTLIFSLITPDLVLFAAGLSLGLGLLAGALAAWRLVRIRPMTLWAR